MKQVLQDLQSGAVVVAETPEPSPARGRLLVRVRASLLSVPAQVAPAKGRLQEPCPVEGWDGKAASRVTAALREMVGV